MMKESASPPPPAPQARLPHAADRLMAAIELKRAPVCVGIDPVVEKLPRDLLPKAKYPLAEDFVNSLEAYCEPLLEILDTRVACVKFQSACFERYGWLGCNLLDRLIEHVSSFLSVAVILDAKRGDIGVSADHYASAAFDTEWHSGADWLTINSYLGEDGITPFLKHEGHGAFALVRTSNPGGDAIQNLELKDGRTVAQAVGEMISRIGSNHVGERGYSSLGAVVGATKKQDAAKLREIMPQQLFLVPGYGAQGGGLDDVLPCFKPDGTGAIVTASRSIIYAFDPKDPNWTHSVADAAAKFADEVGRAVGMRENG